ncbi:MAG: copper resistance protein CopC [Aquihabitans sp.]
MTFRSVLKAVLALGATCAILFASALPASAHAQLISSIPAANGVVAAAPDAVTLQFSEQVAVQPDGIRVLSGDGTRVDLGTASASGVMATSPLNSGLPDGGYVVSWRAISADGHPIRGSFNFSVGQQATVGDDVAEGAFAGSADQRDEVVSAILRAITYIAVLGSAGAVLVGAGLRRDDEPMPVTRLVTAVAALGVVALVLQLPAQASLATGQGWGSITKDGVLDLAIADGVGPALVVTLVGLLAMLITVGLPFRRAVPVVALGGAVVAPLGLVITGHTRTMSPLAVGYAADAAHVVAGAIWFGGLIALGALLHRRHRVGDLDGAARAVARFSGWAAISAGVVVVAGGVMGWIEVGGLSPLTGTTYGKLLLVKVAVVGVVLAGAAWNRFRFVPALGLDEVEGSQIPAAAEVDDVDVDDEESASVDSVSITVPAADRTDVPWTRFRRTLLFEIAGIVVALAITGVLSNVTPAKTAIESGLVSTTTEFGSGTMEVVIDPAKVGPNDLHIYLKDSSGGIDGSYEEVKLLLELPAQDLGPLEVTPVRAGAGHFQVVNTDLPLGGEWTMTVVAKLDRFTEVTGKVSFQVR